MCVKTVAVMAGTPVDTEMGINLLRHRVPDLNLLSYATAPDPQSQTLFQIGPPEQREAALRGHIHDAVDHGAKALLVYCNSLSAAADFSSLCGEAGLSLVTPLMCYTALASRSKRVGVIAANNQSLYGIEKVIMGENPQCEVLGISLLPAVMAIEQGMNPARIAEEFGLNEALRFFERCKAETVVLGCTHFSYLYHELQGRTTLPVLNPDDFMVEKLADTGACMFNWN